LPNRPKGRNNWKLISSIKNRLANLGFFAFHACPTTLAPGMSKKSNKKVFFEFVAGMLFGSGLPDFSWSKHTKTGKV
jgi:hypothetical protein